MDDGSRLQPLTHPSMLKHRVDLSRKGRGPDDERRSDPIVIGHAASDVAPAMPSTSKASARWRWTSAGSVAVSTRARYAARNAEGAPGAGRRRVERPAEVLARMAEADLGAVGTKGFAVERAHKRELFMQRRRWLALTGLEIARELAGK